VNKQDI